MRIIDLNSSRVLTSFPGLVRYLLREKPVAILSALTHANLIAIVARQVARTSPRLFVTEHAHLGFASNKVSSIVDRVMLHLMHYFYPKSDGVVAVSNGVAAELTEKLSLPYEKVHTLYNPVIHQKMLECSFQDVDHPWFEEGAPPVVLAVGRLAQEKNFFHLIHAFAKLRVARDVRLMILGEDALRSELEKEVRDLGLAEVVALPGFSQNPYGYMRRAALCVLTSRHEGFGNVLVEAMACGVQVVSTDCPSGPSEILEKGKWGRLVPVGDVDALANAMIETLDAVEPPDITIRAMDFSVDKAVDKYMQLLMAGLKRYD